MTAADQRLQIVQVLAEARIHVGDDLMTTREVADQTPWSVLTVIQRLNRLEREQSVERGPMRGHNITWRLVVPRGSA